MFSAGRQNRMSAACARVSRFMEMPSLRAVHQTDTRVIGSFPENDITKEIPSGTDVGPNEITGWHGFRGIRFGCMD